jgi:hypothetical protein
VASRGLQFISGLLLGGLLLPATPRYALRAQDTLPPWEGGLTSSLGQPPLTWFSAGASFGITRHEGRAFDPTGLLVFGASRPLSNPLFMVAARAEAYSGLRGTSFDAGVRGLVEIPLMRLALGGDYNIRDNHLSFLLGMTLPFRRSGLFSRGDLLRIEGSPGRLKALRLTLTMPLGQPAAGHTRPQTDEIVLSPRDVASPPPPSDTAGLPAALADVREAARRVGRLVVPYLGRPGPDPASALAPLIHELRDSSWLTGREAAGLDVDGAIRTYHAAMARAFSIAASGQDLPAGETTTEGQLAAARARTILLDRVLYPYDRLLGQRKTEGTLATLAAYARGNFAREVVSLTALPRDRESALLYVFQQLLRSVLRLEREQRDRWGDSRLLWLPLQLGLQPEDYDTQPELDRIIEAATGERFTDGNRVWYVINGQFQVEVVRSIQEAEDYHVLWIHDFAGRNDAGLPDSLTLSLAVDAYLRALARRIREYDQRRRLPTYMVFLDEHYYEVNRARLWLDLLEHPLGPPPRLPRGSEALAASIGAAQQELRDAVAGSLLLQAEARQYGDKWLANMVKVHVSITNQSDPSFWSRQFVPLHEVPDNLMRDHRKVAFYDVSEEDPYRGGAIYTGMGIGEHYVGPTWEDRSIMVQGPALLSLKTQARLLLESQGMRPEQIPYALRPRPLARDYYAAIEQEIARRLALGERTQRVVELHNQTGFLPKQVSVARAVLYSLMPPGAVIKIPDSLWGNSLFAALLAGSAFRGCRVLFVAPSLAAAPAPGGPSMALTHDLFARLIVLQQEFGPELKAVGGMLKTGIYNPGVGVEDVAGRFTTAYQNARRTPFLRRLYPVDPSVDTMFAHANALLGAPLDSAAPGRRSAVAPKLHLKASFFASREAWDRLVARPEIAGVMQAYVSQLLRKDTTGTDVRTAAQALSEASDRLEASFLASLTPEERERVMYYLLIGSANQDYRSMVMDGEASVLLSGWSGVVGLIDFSLIMSLSVWIDDLETLDALIPPPTGLSRLLARQAWPNW